MNIQNNVLVLMGAFSVIVLAVQLPKLSLFSSVIWHSKSALKAITKMPSWMLCSFLFLFSSSASAVTYPSTNDFLWGNTAVNAAGQTTKVNGTGWGYRYLLPKNYDPSKKYPVIIFLHGKDENANKHNGDNAAQLANGANGALALVSTNAPDNRTNYPVFFVAPQNQSGSWALGEPHLRAILQTLKIAYPNAIDEDRICLTGLSAGAFGTWNMAAAMPGIFSCIVPLSGGSQSIADLEGGMPIWAFHAANDGTVAVTGTESSINSWRNYGRKAIFTRYDIGGHNIWRTGYETSSLLPWMMAQRRGQPMAGINDIRIKGSTQATTLNLAVATTPAVPASARVGWSSNFTANIPSGTGTANGTTTYTSSTSNFLTNGTAVGSRIGITYSGSGKTWKIYRDIVAIPSATTLTLNSPASSVTSGFSIYKVGQDENPFPGTGSGANWTLNNIPLSTGFNFINAYLEYDNASLGGKTTINEPFWFGYSVPSGDTTAPAIGFTNPPTGAVSGMLNLTGTASDNVGVTLFWNSDRGYGGIMSGENWSINDVPLLFGNNKITVKAKDEKNNISTAVLDVAYTGVSANQAPKVSAGLYQAITWPTNSVTLAGSVSDDGLPIAAVVAANWSKVSGPGSVLFDNASALSTVATFSQAGSYVLRLTASDTLSSRFHEVVVTVRPNGSVAAAYDSGSATSYQAAGGVAYAADAFFTGSAASAGATIVFDGTEDDVLYRTSRYSNNPSVTYAIPIANGTYDVLLQFAETISVPRIPGMRVFDVWAENQMVIPGLDILSQAGRLVAYDRVIRTTVSDGILNLSLNRVVGAPTISGILVRNAAAIINQPPVANDDAASTDEGVALSGATAINVLANDTDSDIPAQTLSIASVVTPTVHNGTVSIVDGKVEYAPAVGFFGMDSIEYTISDGAATASAHVAVSVNPTSSDLNLSAKGLTGTNVGSGSSGSSRILADGRWELRGVGSGVGGIADVYHGELVALDNNFQMVVRADELLVGGGGRVGLVVREGTAPSAPMLAISIDANNAVRYTARMTNGAAVTETEVAGNWVLPGTWLMLRRQGSEIIAAVSPDGVNYQQLVTQAFNDLPVSLQAGLWIAGGANNVNGRAVVEGFNVTPFFFNQNFDRTDATLDDYISNTPSGSQFNDIANEDLTSAWSIDNGWLKLVRNGGSNQGAGLTRISVPAAMAPTVMEFKFRLKVSCNTFSELALLDLGTFNALADYNNSSVAAGVTNRLSIKGGGNGMFKFYFDSTHFTPNYTADGSTELSVSWMLNQSGSSKDYRGPDNAMHILPSGFSDLWINNILVMSNIPRANVGGSYFGGMRLRSVINSAVTLSFDDFRLYGFLPE